MNLYQDVFFRTLDFLRGRHTIKRLHFLRRSQYWDRETLVRWQLERLNALLLQARNHSAYYERVLQDVKLPLRSLAGIADLPVLTKRDIRENLDALQCRNIPRSRFVKARTGGSTGEPTYYFWDKRGMDWNRGTVYRSAEWAGTALGERTVQMSGSHFDFSEAQKLLSRLTLFLQRYRDYPVAFLDAPLLEKYFRALQQFRPTGIWGYASGISAFAAYIAETHPTASFDFLRAIITSSETLRPEQRLLINRVFGSDKVFDNYGSREMYVGAECRHHNGYHLHADVLYVEVVNKNNMPCQPGELGRILLTDMSNHAFPFIRYEIGDVGTLAPDTPCPCGVTLPRLQSLEGRIADLVTLRDRILTPPNFNNIFSDLSGVRAYQIRQDAIDHLEVILVPDSDYHESNSRTILAAINNVTGPGVHVDLKLVDDIPVPESGKRRYIVSTLSQRGP